MHVPVQFHLVNDWLCFVIGYIFNGALLWLVAKRTKPEMLPYRPVLVFFAARNLLYLAVIAVVVPVLPIDRGSCAVTSLGPLGWLPQPYNFALAFSWNFLFAFAVFSQWVPFVYRYALLCLKKRFGFREYLAMLACPVAVGHVIICYFAGYVPGEFGDPQQQRIHEFFFNETSAALFVPYFADEEHTPWVASYIGSWIIFSYALVVLFGRRIYRYLEHEASTNLSAKRALEINRQVSRALTLLALLPLVVETVPSLWLVVVVLAGLPVGNISAYSTAIFAWAPVIDPLITIWVVHSYRREVRGWLRCKVGTTSTVVTAFRPSGKPLVVDNKRKQKDIKNCRPSLASSS